VRNTQFNVPDFFPLKGRAVFLTNKVFVKVRNADDRNVEKSKVFWGKIALMRKIL